MRTLGLFFLVLLTCPAAFAQAMPLPTRQSRQPSRNVVGSFCRMDYEGFRLTSETWPRMKSLTTWKENPDFQGFTIVSQYDLSPSSDGLRTATVDARYSVLGRFEPGIGFLAEPHRQQVTFRLKDLDSEWKIDELDPPIDPHISKPRAIAWLKSALQTEKDRANKLALEKALKDLGAGDQ